MAKFKVVTPGGASYGASAAEYAFEVEALAPLGAEIVEIPPCTEDEFVKAAKDADALYAKGRTITKPIIDGLERCRVIALGSVGVDSVDVAATASDATLLRINEALEKLTLEDPSSAELVRLRFFVGGGVEEAAEALGISERTAKRYWQFARAWLYDELRAQRERE